MKPLGVKNYGSTPHLQHSKLGKHDKFITHGQHDIIFKKPRKGDLLIVTEKYDGSNAGVARINGILVAITRSGHLAKESDFEHYREFARWVDAFQNMFFFLKEGWRVAGEWMFKQISLSYEIQGQQNVFIAFDIFNDSNKRVLPDVPLFFPTARVLYEGTDSPNHNRLLATLRVGSYFAYTPKPEGYVVQVWNNGSFDFQAKWVREDFEAGVYLNENRLNTIYI